MHRSPSAIVQLKDELVVQLLERRWLGYFKMQHVGMGSRFSKSGEKKRVESSWLCSVCVPVCLCVSVLLEHVRYLWSGTLGWCILGVQACVSYVIFAGTEYILVR